MKDGSAIPYGRHHITEEDIEAVCKVLRSDYLTQGATVQEFEKAFAEYVGSKYAVAVANGTAALHLCAMALNVKPGDKVITTPITFAASANCVKYCGGDVVFSDIDPDTFLLDLKKVEQLLVSSKPGTFKGIIPVDFAGLPVNREAFQELARRFNLWIIEDACHAPGAYFTDSTGKHQHCGNGTGADLAIFSFHPVKHIATGEGGMVTTNSESLYKKLLTLRTHGIVRSDFDKNIPQPNQQGDWYYEMKMLGFNYRITDFQCALGISQLKRAPEGIKRRNDIAKRYRYAFTNTPVTCQSVPENSYHAYHLFVIQVADRKGLYDFLRRHKILAQVHYVPVHWMPYYQELGSKPGDFPVSENYYDHCLSLPMYPSLTDDEQEFVIEKVLEFVK